MVQELSNNKYKELLNSDKIVVIDFYAEWCVPCKTLSPTLDTISEENDKVEIVKYNTEDDELDLTNKYGIRNIPTLVFLKGGEPVDRLTGVRTKDSIISKIDSLI
jgi:thioredoxin 1